MPIIATGTCVRTVLWPMMLLPAVVLGIPSSLEQELVILVPDETAIVSTALVIHEHV